MRILLVGEYSRLHNSLKEGLTMLGHEVVIIGSGDDFKNYPVDINLKYKFNKGFEYLIKRLLYRLFKFDPTSNSIKTQFNRVKNNLKGFDVVQLINENAFNTLPEIEKELLSFILKNNKTIFLLSCGVDYTSVKYAIEKKFKYSILTPSFENRAPNKDFWHILKYTTKPYKELHDFIFKNINGVIASDLDYHLPLQNHPKYLGLVANPINIDKIKYTPLNVLDKIIIFHGVNTKNYIKKGNVFFDEALTVIEKKFPNQVTLIRTEDLPYSEYISRLDQAHIILDQVYAYDQGYNALEAMAKGKVVLTGAEQEWLDYYKLDKNTVAINALPNTESIIENLSWLIKNPENILTISKNARTFVEKEHHYISIAKKYVETWHKYS